MFRHRVLSYAQLPPKAHGSLPRSHSLSFVAQKLKVKLETDVAILEQQLEHMRFTYILNSEKLEYNYRVLSERDHENKATLAAHKTRLSRLKASLDKVRADYEASEAAFTTRNSSLTVDFQRVTRQYKELQDKFRAFESADSAKYSDLCVLHTDEIERLVDKLTSADRVISEQLLGVEWAPPLPSSAPARSSEAEGEGDDVYSDAVNAAAAGLGEEAANSDAPAASLLQHSVTIGGGADDAAAAGGSGRGEMMQRPSEDLTSVEAAKLRAILDVLQIACATLLLEQPTRDKAAELREQGLAAEAKALQGSALLHTIGCTTHAAVTSMIYAFDDALCEAVGEVDDASDDGEVGPGWVVTSVDAACDADDTAGEASHNSNSNSGRSIQLALPLGLPIVPILQAWLEDQAAATGGSSGGANTSSSSLHRRSSTTGSTYSTSGKDLTATGAGRSARANSAATCVSGNNSAASGPQSVVDAEAAHWRTYTEAMPSHRIKLWKALESGLQQYRQALLARSDLNSEVVAMRKANAALREQLQAALSDPSNLRMKEPPQLRMALVSGASEDPQADAAGSAAAQSTTTTAPSHQMRRNSVGRIRATSSSAGGKQSDNGAGFSDLTLVGKRAQ